MKMKSLVLQFLTGCLFAIQTVPLLRASNTEILLKALDLSPKNVGAMLSLAQMYLDLKEYDQAIFWYEKRIAEGGETEEVWYSKFMVATVYEELGNWGKAFQMYQESYRYCPNRAEPLYRIARHFRRNNEPELAYRFAQQAAKIPYPKEQLFVQSSVYDYQIDEEISIAGYYTKFKEEAFAAADRLLLSKKTPESQRARDERNALFYIQNLKNTRMQLIELQRPYVRKDLRIKFNSMNSSICKIEEGYLVVCRCVNYGKRGDATSWALDPCVPNCQFHCTTRNFLLQYDQNFQLVFQKELIDRLSPPYKITPYSGCDGIEDIRLFQYQGNFWLTCTVHDLTPAHVCRIGLFQLGDITEEEFVFTKYFTPLKGPFTNRHEKNWMPVVVDDAIHVIYSYDPLVIYKIDETTGACEELLCEEQKYRFADFRGSAPPVPFDNGYLMVIHQVVSKNGEKIYLHRFVYLDEDCKIEKISKPFTFVHQGIEFCCGMEIDHNNTELVMTVGIEDAHASFVFIDLDFVRQELCHGVK